LRGKGRDQPRRHGGDDHPGDVSVPLRGKGRDQRIGKPGITDQLKVFPSPCGEKVGINGGALRTPRGYKVLFPSPCGEKVGINLDISAKVGAFPKSAVSVPLRGKGRDQLSERPVRSYTP